MAPITSTDHLNAAAESVRQAMLVDGPSTPPEVYDHLAALTELTQRMIPHLGRGADALMKAAGSPLLRAANGDPDPGFTARHIAYRLSGLATERLAAVLAELNAAWSGVSGLYLADPTPTDDVVDAEIVDECPSCESDERWSRGYVPGSTGMPVSCSDEWHDDEPTTVRADEPPAPPDAD